MFLVIEGPDGTGKSTVARLVHGALAASGHRVALHAEPTTGEIGKLIRRALLRQGHRRSPGERQ